MPVTIKPAPGTGSDVATTHVSAAPGAVDYVLDEVQANSTAVAVFDGAASATLAAQTTRVGASSAAPFFGDTAFGYAAQCSGAGGAGVAVGWQARAGTTGVAIGADARALSDNSTTINPADNTKGATAAGAISIGTLCTAGGTNAVAIGHTALAPNNYDIAIGSGADATGGSSSIAIGRDADATAANTIALGHTAVASAAGAIAIGQNATASAADTIAVGASYLAGNLVAQTYTITAGVNDIVPTSAGNATLTAGSYTPTALATHTQSAMNAQIAGAGFTVTYNTSTELFTFARGSAFTMAWGAAGTAFAVFGFPQTTTASATSQVGISQRPDAAELSPAVSAAVELGSPFRAYGKLYVDAIYPRTRLTDYIRLTMTQTSGGGGAWANSTSANHIVFPGLAAPTWSVSSTVAAPGSCFSNGSSSTAFAARYTYTPSTAYSRVLVTVSVNNFRGGTGTGNVNLTIGAGATAV